MKALKVISLYSVILIAVGCNSDRISQLEKQNQELKTQLDRDRTVHDLDLQSKCSNDAKIWFNENWASSRNEKETMLLDFSNHYNKSSNKCFIFVEYHFGHAVGASWTNNITLWDVYENSKYGDFAENHFISYSGEPKDTVITCEVLDKKCTSVDQFNSLVQPYMNN